MLSLKFLNKLSFQWRITLMTAALISITCIILNVLVYRSGICYFEVLEDYIVEYDKENYINNNGKNESYPSVTIEIAPEDISRFSAELSSELSESKSGFRINGWVITVMVTLVSSSISYFVSGLLLSPIRSFSADANRIHPQNLTDTRLFENTIPEFQVLSKSVNSMLDRLSHAFEIQKQFSGDVAHELKTPLALMQIKIDTYKEEFEGKCIEADEALNLLSENTQKLTDIVKTLLDMSDMKAVSKNEKICIPDLADEILADLAPVAEKLGIDLIQSVEDVSVVGSDTLLYRVLFNLVENAIKYNCPGGRVTIEAKKEHSDCIIRVSDTGPGISDRYKESIFRPFFRIDTSRSRKSGGVGLGLALVWEAVNLHQGNIRVEDNFPQGSIFIIRLPICDEEAGHSEGKP